MAVAVVQVAVVPVAEEPVEEVWALKEALTQVHRVIRTVYCVRTQIHELLLMGRAVEVEEEEEHWSRIVGPLQK